MTGEQFEARDRLPPAQREAELFARLPDAIAHAVRTAPGWARHLAGIDPASISSRAALAGMPVLRKSDLLALQKQHPPFGGFLSGEIAGAPRVYMSPARSSNRSRKGRTRGTRPVPWPRPGSSRATWCSIPSPTT